MKNSYLTDIKSSDSNAVIATQYLIDNIEAKTIIGGITSSETDVTQLFSRVNKVKLLFFYILFYCFHLLIV